MLRGGGEGAYYYRSTTVVDDFACYTHFSVYFAMSYE